MLSGAIEDWDVDDVCTWMANLPKSISQDIIENFRTQDVNGAILKEITDDHLKSDEFPDIKTLGQRLFIIKYIKILFASGQKSAKQENKNTEGDQTSQSVNQKECDTKTTPGTQIDPVGKSVTARKFDSGIPRGIDKYTKDSILQYDVLRVDDLITPVNMFSDLDVQESASELKMARLVARFVCACLNERTNGRLFIGVGEEEGKDLGRIKGTVLHRSPNDYNRMLDNIIEKCFCPEQNEDIQKCVRPFRFIEVIDNLCGSSSTEDKRRYVIELEVIPDYSTCVDQAFFVYLPREPKDTKTAKVEKEQMALYRIIDREIVQVQNQDLVKYMERKQNLSKIREYRETKILRDLGDDARRRRLAEKFKNLICIGAQQIGGVYPILVCNQPGAKMTDDEIESKFSFVRDIPWIASFDFDPDGRLQKFLQIKMEQNMTVVASVNEFTESKGNSPQKSESLQDDLLASKTSAWVFANGFREYDESEYKPLGPIEWQTNKRQSLKDAIDF